MAPRDDAEDEDVDMMDEDDSDSEDLDDSDEESGADESARAFIVQLRKDLKEAPYDAQLHVALISSWRERAELDHLRAARKSAAVRVPLPESTWLQWIEDERRLATDDDFAELDGLHRQACIAHPLSPKLWLARCALYREVPGQGADATRAVYEAALECLAMHPSSAGDVWTAYRDFEKSLGQGKEEAAAAKRVRALFFRQLALPLKEPAAVVEEHKAFEGGLKAKSAKDPVALEKAAALAESAKELWTERAALEEQLEEALQPMVMVPAGPPGSEGAAEAAKTASAPEISKQLLQFDEESGDPSRVLLAHLRATDITPKDAERWLHFADAASTTLESNEKAAEALERAVLQLPENAALWQRLHLEREAAGTPLPGLKAVQERALAALVHHAQTGHGAARSAEKKLEATSALQDLILQHADACRRAATAAKAAGGDNAEAVATCWKEMRAACERCLRLSEGHEEYAGLRCQALLRWLKLEAYCAKDAKAAIAVGNRLMEAWGSFYNVWSSFTSAVRACAGADSYDLMRDLYRRAVSQVADYPEQAANDYVEFERDCGSLASWLEARKEAQLRFPKAAAAAAAVPAAAAAAAETAQPAASKAAVAGSAAAEKKNAKKASKGKAEPPAAAAAAAAAETPAETPAEAEEDSKAAEAKPVPEVEVPVEFEGEKDDWVEDDAEGDLPEWMRSAAFGGQRQAPKAMTRAARKTRKKQEASAAAASVLEGGAAGSTAESTPVAAAASKSAEPAAKSSPAEIPKPEKAAAKAAAESGKKQGESKAAAAAADASSASAAAAEAAAKEEPAGKKAKAVAAAAEGSEAAPAGSKRKKNEAAEAAKKQKTGEEDKEDDGEEKQAFHTGSHFHQKRLAESAATLKPEDEGQQTVYVSNLDWSVDEAVLNKIFNEVEGLKEVRLVRDFLQRSKGFAYVDFETSEHVENAVKKLNGHLINKRPMKVARSLPTKPLFEEKTLFVTQIPAEGTEENVKTAFSPFGEVKEVRMPAGDKKSKHKGYAYVEYVDAGSVQKALDALGTSPISIAGASVTVARSIPMKDHRHQKAGSRKDLPARLNQKQIVEDREAKADPVKQAAKFPCTVYVKDMAFTVDEAALRKHFEECGPIKDVLIVKNAQGKSRGFGFVEFEKAEAAQSALTYTNSILGGREISVSRSQRAITQKKTGGGGGGGGAELGGRSVRLLPAS
eukprot:TRINITY_DN5176_c0_g4_i1.p1 TRINITY_DN5176_c0_g4~~TRINITY_DN5176_c0_g4_i1.p1  ORF type:complete len:1210 (+),score=428.62 TRINITY_DN5176_c0_g4_i1:57-3632(+)